MVLVLLFKSGISSACEYKGLQFVGLQAEQDSLSVWIGLINFYECYGKMPGKINSLVKRGIVIIKKKNKTSVLKLLCTFIFSAADEEAFEDNSEEYIRRDLEGSGNPQIYTKNTWSLNIALNSVLLRLLKLILELWKLVFLFPKILNPVFVQVYCHDVPIAVSFYFEQCFYSFFS